MTQVLALPVPKGTVIVVDPVLELSAESLVSATVDIWPSLAGAVAAVRAALGTAPQLALPWSQRICTIELPRGATNIVRQVMTSLDFVHQSGTRADTLSKVAAAAVVIDAVGPAIWVCPSIPWRVGSDASGVTSLPADVAPLCLGSILQTNTAVSSSVTRDGAALMAFLRAFDSVVPAQVRLAAQGCAIHGLNGQLSMRLLVLDPVAEDLDSVVVLTFDIDDQTPEDLAIGLDHIRALSGVLSATVSVTTGKKGRMSFRVEVLAQPEQFQEAINCCLSETSTIGLRWQVMHRATLARSSEVIQGNLGINGAVKRVIRPGGASSAKVEADVLAASGLDMIGRNRLRVDLESKDSA